MFPFHEKDTTITEAQLAFPEVQRIMANLQGNILRPHGRDHAVHIFLEFRHDKMKEAKKWIQQISDVVTSAQQQNQEAHDYRHFGIPGGTFCSFFLSIKGYRALDLDFPADRAFRAGMQNRGNSGLNDPSVKDWECGYQRDIHAMLMLADDDEPGLLREARHHLTAIRAFGEVCTIEHGKVIRNDNGQHTEHFGYVDGRSQPLFFAREVGLDRGIGHFMLFEVDSKARAPAPLIPKSPQTSSAASDRKSARLPSSRQVE